MTKMLHVQFSSFCRIKKISNTFNDYKNASGEKWLRLFLKRYPELARREAQMMNSTSTQKLNEDIVAITG